MIGKLRNNGCDCQCRTKIEIAAAECIEEMAKDLCRDSWLRYNGEMSLMEYADRHWLDEVPTGYRDLVSDE